MPKTLTALTSEEADAIVADAMEKLLADRRENTDTDLESPPMLGEEEDFYVEGNDPPATPIPFEIITESGLDHVIPDHNGTELEEMYGANPQIVNIGGGILQIGNSKARTDEIVQRALPSSVLSLVFAAYNEPHIKTVERGMSTAVRTPEGDVKLSLFTGSTTLHLIIKIPAMIILDTIALGY